MFKQIAIFLILLLLFSCSVGKEFKDKFEEHISDSDSILFDGDNLHPTYAYIKDRHLIGIESVQNPECGKVFRRYFINQNEKIEKIIYEIDFYDDHCGITFDSVYVIEPTNGTVKVYTEATNGKLINDVALVENELAYFDKFKKSVKDWKRKK